MTYISMRYYLLRFRHSPYFKKLLEEQKQKQECFRSSFYKQFYFFCCSCFNLYYYMIRPLKHVQGRHSNQCCHAMALVNFLVSKYQKYQKSRICQNFSIKSLEVALVNFHSVWRPWVFQNANRKILLHQSYFLQTFYHDYDFQ